MECKTKDMSQIREKKIFNYLKHLIGFDFLQKQDCLHHSAELACVEMGWPGVHLHGEFWILWSKVFACIDYQWKNCPCFGHDLMTWLKICTLKSF